MTNDLPLRLGATGDAVRDVQRRLAALGFDAAADPPGTYGSATEDAARRFQAARGLRVDGVCGRQTWASLVEAGYRLGERLLYLRTPMLRGDDVERLQQELGGLGFDAGRVDGIFGPQTMAALEAFQRNTAIVVDGVFGPATAAALRRVARDADDATTVAAVRELEHLREGADRLERRRLCVGETGGLAALADAVGRALAETGAVVAVLHHPDDTVQASEANAFGADAFLGIALRADAGSAAYFYAAGRFESVGGRRLAELLCAELVAPLPQGTHTSGPMRVPLLRETKMPAVLCELGPPTAVVERTGELARSFTTALGRWVEGPIEG